VLPSIGPLELVIILVIALVIFGPKRLPDVSRSVGHGIRDFKSAITSADPRDELKSTIASADPRDELKSTIASADPREERKPEQRD
jgi:sec-independent protein translocase protein TatA